MKTTQRKTRTLNKREFKLLRFMRKHGYEEITDYQTDTHFLNRWDFFIKKPNGSELDFLENELIENEKERKILEKQKELVLCSFEELTCSDESLNDECLLWDKILIKNLENLQFIKQKIISERQYNEPNLNEEKHSYNDNIFTSQNAENLLRDYLSQHVIEPYIDLSFIFQQLKAKEQIRPLTHLKFAKWLREENLITDKVYKKIFNKNGFRSLDKSTSINRQNNYQNLLDKHIEK